MNFNAANNILSNIMLYFHIAKQIGSPVDVKSQKNCGFIFTYDSRSHLKTVLMTINFAAAIHQNLQSDNAAAVEEFEFFHRRVGEMLIYCP